VKKTALRFTSPTEDWIEGLPIGNSKSAVMVYGKPGEERLCFNYDECWRKSRIKTVRLAHVMPEIRRLVLEGEGLKAEDVVYKNTREGIDEINPYQPFFDINAKIRGISNVEGYSRGIELNNGVGYTEFINNGNSIRYEFFAEHKSDVVVVRLTAKAPISLSLDVTRPEDNECRYLVEYRDNTVKFDARFDEGLGFSAGVRLCTDGVAHMVGGSILVDNMTYLTLYTVMTVDREDEEAGSQRDKKLDSIINADYTTLLEGHITDFSSLFDRCELELGGSEDVITSKIYEDMCNGKSIATELYEQLFAMAKYMMISSSRPGSLPINLQGIWCHDIAPMWECSYTMDMNMQMYYWLTMPLGLHECEEPLFDWLTKMTPKLNKQCKEVFGADGIFVPQYTDRWAEITKGPFGQFQTIWSGAAAWLCRHFFEYWQYTDNDEFLLERAVPFMRLTARFYRDFLVKNEEGRYILCPSCSPENRTVKKEWMVNTATMDITLIHELMGNLLYINEKFSLNDEDASFWRDIDENIVDYPVRADGVLDEWVQESEQEDPYHRHISHIYGIFPGKLFTEGGDKRLYDAAVAALLKRRSGGFGSCATWSHAWYTCCFSRIGDGDTALSCVKDLMQTGMICNYLTTHNDWRDSGRTNTMIKYRLFQIDALLGVVAGISEMFIQSFVHEIRILPAIPNELGAGHINGVCAYHGVTVDVEWDENKHVTRLSALAKNDTRAEFNLCRENKRISVYLKAGEKEVIYTA